MTRNQLPEGVGKKIVEALKRQAEADITPIDENENVINNSLPLTNIEELSDAKFETALEQENDLIENMIVEEEIPVPIENEEIKIQPQELKVSAPNTVEKPQFVLNPELASKINIPANVLTIRNLIATLPAGVTKQTGAQIIKQTIEAMGISMTGVLKEAQQVQEELNGSTRECMLKIQEYKTNILQLEQAVQEYQKNIAQINDLVSLFLLTNK